VLETTTQGSQLIVGWPDESGACLATTHARRMRLSSKKCANCAIR
jgi:hypothetical protein